MLMGQNVLSGGRRQTKLSYKGFVEYESASGGIFFNEKKAKYSLSIVSYNQKSYETEIFCLRKKKINDLQNYVSR